MSIQLYSLRWDGGRETEGRYHGGAEPEARGIRGDSAASDGGARPRRGEQDGRRGGEVVPERGEAAEGGGGDAGEGVRGDGAGQARAERHAGADAEDG
jgi:hypothetical protein